MEYKIIFIFILLLTSLFLAGCYEKKTSNEKIDTETITIGALLPLSGKNAVYGIEIQNAIELAREEINAKGGINEKQLKVIYEDDGANPKKGTDAMKKLVEVNNVPIILGPWASGVVLAVAPIAQEHEVIIMASAVSPAITLAGDYIFRMQPSAEYYISEVMPKLIEKQFANASIVYLDNEFGKALADVFEKEFTKYGGKIIATESYQEGDTDFRSQLTKIKSKNSQIIFLSGYQETLTIIKQMNELDIAAQIVATATFESESTISTLGELAEGILYPYHFVAGKNNSKAVHYEQAYVNKYNIKTGGFAPVMYDGVYIIAGALEKCDINTNCIKEALYDTDYEGVVGKTSFDENGDPLIPIIMKTVKDGEFVAI